MNAAERAVLKTNLQASLSQGEVDKVLAAAPPEFRCPECGCATGAICSGRVDSTIWVWRWVCGNHACQWESVSWEGAAVLAQPERPSSMGARRN